MRPACNLWNKNCYYMVCFLITFLSIQDAYIWIDLIVVFHYSTDRRIQISYLSFSILRDERYALFLKFIGNFTQSFPSFKKFVPFCNNTFLGHCCVNITKKIPNRWDFSFTRYDWTTKNYSTSSYLYILPYNLRWCTLLNLFLLAFGRNTSWLCLWLGSSHSSGPIPSKSRCSRLSF